MMSFTRRSLLKSVLIASLGGSFFLRAACSQQAVSDNTAKNGTLKIGIIGAGWLGGTVGRCWVKTGHSVMFSSRHPEALKKLTAQLGERALIGTPKQAAAFGDIVLFSVPFDALPVLGKELAEEIRGKIVIDATNPPLSGGNDPLTREAAKTGVAQTVKKYLPDSRLVRAFSAVDATVVEASFNGERERVGMPMASDDKAALAVVAALVQDAGCEPVVTGNLASSKIFNPGEAGFRAHLPADKLRERLGLK